MAKIVYVDWKDRQFEPEIAGVFTNDSDGYVAREKREYELKDEGYDTDDEVRVWIEDVDIQLNNDGMNIDENGNVFMVTEKYEYMYANGKMYVRTRLNTDTENPFDYTDVEELIEES